MRNYFRLYISYFKRSIISRLQYKKDTFIAIFSFLLSNAAKVATIFIVVNSFPTINGWNMWQFGFLYGFAMLPVGLDHLFSDELWLIAYRRVKDGSVDSYFFRPLPILFQVISETFQPEGFGELIVGVTMLVMSSCFLSINWTFPLVFLLIISTIFGALIITSLKILFSSFAFRFKRSGPLLQIVYNFIDFAKYPSKVFPRFIRNLLLFVFPFLLFITLPVEILFNVDDTSWIYTVSPYWVSAIIVGATILIFTLSILIWNWNIKKYESTGN